MARLINGILGGIKGMVGNIEGYQLNGAYIIRSKRKKTGKLPSDKQLATRQAMKLVNHFLRVCTPFVNVGYREEAELRKVPAYSLAVSNLMKHAITGDYPNQQLDYSKVFLSYGSLQLLASGVSLQLEGQTLVFSWTLGGVGERSTDHVMLLAYCPELNEAVYELCGAKRITGTEKLEIPVYWQGKQINTWLSFVEENGIRCTNSSYLENYSLSPKYTAV